MCLYLFSSAPTFVLCGFHSLQCWKRSDFKTLTVHPQTFDFFCGCTMELSSCLCCGNNFLLSVVFFFFHSIPCHHRHHHLTCVETMHWSLSFPHSSLWGACYTAVFTILIFLTNVLIKEWLENYHKSWFLKWKYYSLLDGITMSLGSKSHILPLRCFFFFFSYPVLQENLIWWLAAVSLCITQHLKENFWFC